jgi:hypothetical protein
MRRLVKIVKSLIWASCTAAPPTSKIKFFRLSLATDPQYKLQTRSVVSEMEHNDTASIIKATRQ